MSAQAGIAASYDGARRVRSTPYARRLARERNVPLGSLKGSGPGGRILGQDVMGFVPAAKPSAEPHPEILQQPVMAAMPEALAVRVEMAALETLARDLGALQASVSAQVVVLKAGAMALGATTGWPDQDALLLDGTERILFKGLQAASLGAVAARRTPAKDHETAGLAVSFLARKGIRPVAARLVEGSPARLIIGAAADGHAECLLSYDPDRIDAEMAAGFLDELRGLLETPLRILV